MFSGPLSDFLWRSPDPDSCRKVSDILQSQKLIRQSDLPIFGNLRIPVAIQLNVHVLSWKEETFAGYFAQQLLGLTDCSFP